ncbi:zinc finger, CCHC-type containing protein [Tanacetum coccineum]
MGKRVGELHAMLIEYETGLPKKAETPQVMMIKGGKIQKSNKKSLKAKGKGKANGKGKDKKVYIPKPKNPKPSSKEHPAKDDTCHYCKEVGHCKRNCPAYLAELIKKKKQVGTANSSDVFIIESFSFPTKSWVYDTSCGTHIYNTKYGLEGVRKLKQVEAIGSFDLVLPNGLVIYLDNCHYAPSITRGVVSVYRLVQWIVVPAFYRFLLFLSKNNVHYFNAIPTNGIYEIDMHNLVPNVNSIYNVSTKRAKHNLDSTYHVTAVSAHIKAWGGDVWLGEVSSSSPTWDFYPFRRNRKKYSQVQGFVDPNHPKKVCKLQRSIYGLKQASRSWNKRFDEEIKRFGFAQNLDEPCVYQKASGSNVTFLILYVDDIIIMGNHIPSLQSVKDYLGKCFAMKDLGEAAFILGIKIYRDRSKRLIGLGQNAYMDKILKRYKMDNSKRGHIPMQEKT